MADAKSVKQRGPLLGDIIKQERLRYGKTLEDLHNDTDLSVGYLSKVERNLVFPTLHTLNTIGDYLGGKTAGDFLAGTAKLHMFSLIKMKDEHACPEVAESLSWLPGLEAIYILKKGYLLTDGWYGSPQSFSVQLLSLPRGSRHLIEQTQSFLVLDDRTVSLVSPTEREDTSASPRGEDNARHAGARAVMALDCVYGAEEFVADRIARMSGTRAVFIIVGRADILALVHGSDEEELKDVAKDFRTLTINKQVVVGEPVFEGGDDICIIDDEYRIRRLVKISHLCRTLSEIVDEELGPPRETARKLDKSDRLEMEEDLKAAQECVRKTLRRLRQYKA
jgi:transcriptional regulator with XRE-family HTH domain